MADMIACCTLLLVYLLSAQADVLAAGVGLHAAGAGLHTAGAGHMFKDMDPDSGAELSCEQCPPGQFLRRRCTSSHRSLCEDCPPGSYTALWNHISRCLRCSVCGRHMVQSRQCSRHSDCSCKCRHGYYYKERAGMCVQWSECGTSHGVSVPGTPVRDTECRVCSNGTFSDQASSENSCSAHSQCQGSKVILRGSTWHDAICASCEEVHGHGAWLRRWLRSFFAHHGLSLRRLRHLLGKLSPGGAPALRRLTQDQLRTRLDLWISESTADQIQNLPQVLTGTGALYAAERLAQKLDRITSNLAQICPRLDQNQTRSYPGADLV